MTVALVLAGDGRADQGPGAGGGLGAFREELAEKLGALGVSRVDAADGDGRGMLTVAAAARAAGDRVLICGGMPPSVEIARLLKAGRTAAVAGHGSRGALLVNPDDLGELAEAAEKLAANHRNADPVGALLGELARRGVAVRVVDGALDSQVTELVTDPVAADVARWARERELTPMALYGVSLSLGLLGATWFSELALRAKAFAIIVVFAAFVTARAAHMLDVTLRVSGDQRSPAASWFRLATAIITEFALYAGIAASSAVTPGAGDGLSGIFGASLTTTFVANLGGQGAVGVWRLAIAAMGLLAVRQMTERCAATAGIRTEQPRAARLISLPAGERLTLLCASVVLVGSRFAFAVLLAWGAVAFAYSLTGLFKVRSEDRLPADAAREIAASRGDGPISLWLGRLVAGRIPPILPLTLGLLVTCMLTALGLGNLPGILVLTPVVAMLLSALGSSHPHDGTGDWIVPGLLQASEFLYITALAFAHKVTDPVTFALLAAIIVRHFEIACRAAIWPGSRRAGEPGLGWEGRMLLAGLACLLGILPIAYAIMTGWLWLMLIRDFLTKWVPSGYRRCGGLWRVASPDDGYRKRG